MAFGRLPDRLQQPGQQRKHLLAAVGRSPTSCCLPRTVPPLPQAEVGSRALTEGCVLVLQDRTPIGCIEEIFGPGTAFGLPLAAPSACQLSLAAAWACPLPPSHRICPLCVSWLFTVQCLPSGANAHHPALAALPAPLPQLASGTKLVPCLCDLIPRSDEPVLRAALRGPAAHASQPGAGGCRIQREQVCCFGLGEEQQQQQLGHSSMLQLCCPGCFNQRASLSQYWTRLATPTPPTRTTLVQAGRLCAAGGAACAGL